MKKISIILGGFLTFFFGVEKVFAAYGLNETAGTAGLSTGGTVQGITGNVIGAILTMVGVLFLVLMVYGGIIWMTARGNEQQTQKALNTIIAAVIGLVIVLGSYAFTTFVFSSVNDSSSSSLSCKYNANPANPCSVSYCDVLTTPATCIAPASGNVCCEWR